MDNIDIKRKRLENNASRYRQRVKGNKVMAKWPLRGRDVAGDLLIMNIVSVCLCVWKCEMCV